MIQTLIAWGPAAVWAAVLFLLSEVQGAPRPELAALNDKVVHLVLYGVLGATLAWGRRSSRAGVPHWALLLVGVAYGAADEWHQRFVPDRHASLADLAADVVGLSLGYLLLFGALRVLRGEPRDASEFEGRRRDS